jgi:hypothetical protein
MLRNINSTYLHILRSQCGVYKIKGRQEVFVLLGCYATLIGCQLPTFRKSLSHLQESLEGGTDRLYRNVGNELQINAA